MSMNGTRLPQLVPDRVRGVSRLLLSRVWNDDRVSLSVSGSDIMDTLPPDSVAQDCTFRTVVEGEYFGKPGGAFEYRLFRVAIPPALSTAERFLFWDCDGEGTVYLNGEPWVGLDVAHRSCPLPEGHLDLLISVGTFQRGIWVGTPLPADTPCQFRRAYTATRNVEMWDLYWDLEVLRQLMDHQFVKVTGSLPDGEGHHPALFRAPVSLRKLLTRLDSACDAIEMDDIPGVRKLLAATYREFAGSGTDGRVALVGHSHLDLVWLWPERATCDKAVHTTATALRMIERYPELIYSQSAPHQYHELGRRAPGLMNQVRDRMRAGRWEATGGLYLEGDVNLPCGEGLARSFLYGQGEFQALTGSMSSCLWLPDVFGYPACLPQVMRLAGIGSFFTTKLSWSTITSFPFTAFNWQSHDGSSVLAFQSPVGYTDPVTVDTVSRCIELNRQTGVLDMCLMPAGYGDGGGGITEEMLETARRMKSLAGIPSVTWTSAEGFFGSVAEVADDLPVYEGELYLEYHRGTLTTQSRFKWLYRANERAMQLREAVRAAFGLAPLTIDDWRRLMFAQFHDALPGSSIAVVYEELEQELSDLRRNTLSLADSELASGLGAADGEDLSKEAVWVFNPVALKRAVIVDAVSGEGGSAAPGIARCSGVGLFPVEIAATEGSVFPEVSDRVLDNGTLRAEFTDGGELVALTVHGRPLKIRECAFRLCRDNPAKYDAWEIDYATAELGHSVLSPVGLVVAERTAVRAVLKGSAVLGDESAATLRYILPAESDHLLVELDINWAESHRLLQYRVQTDYRGRDAVYGEPFCSVRRRQKPGLPSDTAKWEVAGQRWAAVCTETGSDGVAIVTQSKYGFSCTDGELRLSLLRAPASPDPGADRGEHVIRFAIGAFRAHTDEYSLSTAAAAEAIYGEFALVRTGEGLAGARRPAALIGFANLGSLTPSWVKPAEDGGGIVLRLHECAGEEGEAELKISRLLAGTGAPTVTVTDLLERPADGGTLRLTGTDDSDFRYSVPFGPYEIISLKIDGPLSAARHAGSREVGK